MDTLSSPTRRSALRGGLALAAGLLAPAAPFAARAARADAVYPGPGADWPRDTPANVGLRADKLLEAQDFALRWGGAGCVVRYGKLVHAWGSFTQLYPINSATKSWGSVVLGWARTDGRLGLERRVQRDLPNLGQKPATNAGTGWLDDITYGHLATHTGGFEEQSGYGRLLAQPGTRWIYSNGGHNWLANALTNIYRQDLRRLTQDRLFTPLGLTSTEVRWRTPARYFTDPVYGLPATEFNGGMQASVNAMARLGYLFLRGGNWQGRQILPGSFVSLATKSYYPRIPVSTLKLYGLMWWANTNGYVAGVPRDAYYAQGKNDNIALVIPSLDIVAVRVGMDGWRNHGGEHESFMRPIAEAATG